MSFSSEYSILHPMTLFVIDSNRAISMFLSSPNRFQMFSSCFQLTWAQKIFTSIPRISLIDSFMNKCSWPITYVILLQCGLLLTDMEGNVSRQKKEEEKVKWSTSSLILVPIFIKKAKWLAIKLQIQS